MKAIAPFALTLLWKVAAASLKRQVKKIDGTKANTVWMFVDYASAEVKVGANFDALFEGREKKLSGEPVQINLIKVLDQMGNSLSAIPEGFQTVCHFEFAPVVPEIIQQLKEEKTWVPNPDSIAIARHSDIQLSIADESKLVYSIAMESLKNAFISYQHHSGFIKRDVFIKHIRKAYKTKKHDAEKMVGNMVSLGLLDEKEDEQLELVSR